MAGIAAAPGGRSGARGALAVAAGLAAAAAVVALVFVRPGWDGGPTFTWRLDAGRFLARLRASRSWLGPFLAVAAWQPLLRALVWRALLPAPRGRLADAYHATALGALVHNALPGKLGPLAAAWVLARTTGRALAPALSAQLVAKLLELGATVALAAAAATWPATPPALRAVVGAGAALFALLAATAAALAFGAPRVAARLSGRFPRAGGVLAALGDGLGAGARSGRLGPAVALAALPAAASALAWGIPLRAAGVPASLAGGALLVAVIVLGQLTPGLPIGAAVSWALAAWGARQLGATAEDAAALAVAGDAAMVAAAVGVGAASALVRRGALRDLLRWRRGLAPGPGR